MDHDSRLAVRFGGVADGGPAIALLIEEAAPGGVPGVTSPPAGSGSASGAACVARFAVPAAAHLPGCACCLPRGPAAVALGRLFLARARGEVAPFDSVVAVTRSAAGAASVRAALDADVVTRARFRLASG